MSAPIKITFPTHPTLNPDGQFSQLEKNADKYVLRNPNTHQHRELEDKDLILALQTVVVPLMS
jgi:hypothetical protein